MFVADDGLLRVGYEDSDGRVVSADAGGPSPIEFEWHRFEAGESRDLLLRNRYYAVSLAERASRYLFDLFREVPLFREGPHGSGAIPLPVLVVPPRSQRSETGFVAVADAMLQALGLNPGKYVVGVEVPGTGQPPPFEVPFDIGYTTTEAEQLQRFPATLMTGLEPEEVDYAFRVRRLAATDLRRRGRDFDVVVTSMETVLDAFGGRRQQRHGPRLIIADDTATLSASLRPDRLPADTTLIAVSLPDAGRRSAMTEALLRGLTHDLPLHEALAGAGRELGLDATERSGVRLWTSPAGLDAIRLQGAYEQFTSRTQELVRLRGVGRGVELAPHLLISELDPARIDAAITAARVVHNDFSRESAGLTELAKAAAAHANAAPDIETVRLWGGRLAAEPTLASALASTQHRRVSIWISHDPSSLVATRMPEIDRSTVLARGRRYVVNVAIGVDWPTDLVSPETPPIDPILPPTDEGGHDIDVAIFSDTTKLIDEPAKVLRLGLLGPAGPVTFVVETPARRRRTRMRVLLYHKHHILQAFTLWVRLDDEESHRPNAISTHLTYSRREQLRKLDDLPERALCVATNSSRGSHRFMFDSGYDVAMSETTVAELQQFFRTMLAAAFRQVDANGNLKPATLTSTVKDLAVKGNDVWLKLFVEEGRPLQTHLEGVRKTSGKTIQLLRLEPEFAFPWSMVYDWPLPETIDELNAAALCLGAENGHACSCDESRPGKVCVRGFWGVRHVIEELVGQDQVDEHVDTVSGAPGVPAVICTLGVTGDPWSNDLVDGLNSTLGTARFRNLTAEESLLDRLWNLAARPAVLVAIGHLTTKEKPGETWRPRIYVAAKERYLDTVGLAQKQIKNGRWETPYRPVVLLLACGSGKDELGKLHSFVTTLSSVGASAIIATEEQIDTRLAADVAHAVISRLATAGPGEALRAWRADALRKGNPFGFLFTCFGSADARVEELTQSHPPV